MGLDMYLECSTKGCRKKQREIEKQLEALDKLHCVLSGCDDDMVYWYQASW